MTTKTKPVPRNDKICVWTPPEGSQPAVRVQVDKGKILAEDLLAIVAETLEIHKSSLEFFALFRGIEYPTVKYGNNEMLYLPCRDVVSFQRWSFDLEREKRMLTTDAGAHRLLCIQCIEDVKNGRIKPRVEHLPFLEEYSNPTFPCEKQYVELCQTLTGYGNVYFPACIVQSDLSVKELKVKQGTKVNLIASRRGIVFKTGKLAFLAPWRKIRRWTQAQGNSIHFEIYFTHELEFHWFEIETQQALYLMAVIAEFIYLMKKATEEPTPRLPSWLRKPKKKILTWKMIKRELFGKRKGDDEDKDDEDKVDYSDDEEVIEKFDDLKEEASTDEEISDGEGGEAMAARTPRRGSGYLPRA